MENFFIFPFPFIIWHSVLESGGSVAQKVGGQDPEESMKSDPVLTAYCPAGALGEGTVLSSRFFLRLL